MKTELIIKVLELIMPGLTPTIFGLIYFHVRHNCKVSYKETFTKDGKSRSLDFKAGSKSVSKGRGSPK